MLWTAVIMALGGLSAALRQGEWVSDVPAELTGPESRLCDGCKWAVNTLDDLLVNPERQAEVVVDLDKLICSHFNTESAEKCREWVRTGVERVADLIEEHLQPTQVCHPFCPSGSELIARQDRFAKSSCLMCHYLTEKMARGSRDTAPQDPLEQCDLPAVMQKPCLEFAASKRTLLAAGANSDMCALIGSCPLDLDAGQTPAVQSVLSTFRRVAAATGAAYHQELCPAPTFRQMVGSFVDTPSKACEFCKIAVVEIRAKIEDPNFQQELEAELRKLCGHLGQFATQCVNTVQEYAPLVFSLLVEYMQPETLCEEVRLCKKPSL